MAFSLVPVGNSSLRRGQYHEHGEIWDLESLESRSRGRVKVWVADQVRESQALHSVPDHLFYP